MFGRRFRSQFDNLHPDLGKKARTVQAQQAKGHDVRAKPRAFVVGDQVYARNYGQGPIWLPGKVVEIHGTTLFTVQLEDGRKVRKHLDQLLARARSTPGDSAESMSRDAADESDAMEYSSRRPSGEPEEGCEPSESTSRELNAAGTPSSDPNPGSDDVSSDNATDQGDRSVEQEQSEPRRSNRSRNPPERYGNIRTY